MFELFKKFTYTLKTSFLSLIECILGFSSRKGKGYNTSFHFVAYFIFCGVAIIFLVVISTFFPSDLLEVFFGILIVSCFVMLFKFFHWSAKKIYLSFLWFYIPPIVLDTSNTKLGLKWPYLGQIPTDYLIQQREAVAIDEYTGRGSLALDTFPIDVSATTPLMQDWCFFARVLGGIDPFDASRWTPISQFPFKVLREYVVAPEFAVTQLEWVARISSMRVTNNFLFLWDLDGLTFLFVLLKCYGRYGVYLPEFLIFVLLLYFLVKKVNTDFLFNKIFWILHLSAFLTCIALCLPFAPTELFTGYKADGYGTIIKVIFLFLAIAYFSGVSIWELQGSARKENYIVALFFFLFSFIMITCSNFWLFFLSLEGISFCVITFFVFNFSGKGHISDAVRYFCLNSIASGMFLVSIGLGEYVTNTVDYAEFGNFFLVNPHIAYIPNSFLLAGLLFLFGSMFKLGLFPFNVYEIDTYKKSSFIVIYFVSIVAKAPFFFVWFKLVWRVIPFIKSLFPVLFLFGFLTAAIGTLAALFQTVLRPFLTYSSMAHTGLIILSFTTETTLGVNSALLYLISYFAAMTIIYLTLNTLEGLNLDFHGLHQLRELRGDTMTAVSFTIAILSLAGFPITLGFFAKLGVLVNLASIGQLAYVIIILCLNVLSFAYYARIIKVIWLEVNAVNALKYVLVDLEKVRVLIAKHDPFYPVHMMAVLLVVMSFLIVLSFKFIIAMTGALWCVALYAVDWSWFIQWGFLDFKLWWLYTKRDWLAANRVYYWYKTNAPLTSGEIKKYAWLETASKRDKLKALAGLYETSVDSAKKVK